MHAVTHHIIKIIGKHKQSTLSTTTKVLVQEDNHSSSSSSSSSDMSRTSSTSSGYWTSGIASNVDHHITLELIQFENSSIGGKQVTLKKLPICRFFLIVEKIKASLLLSFSTIYYCILIYFFLTHTTLRHLIII